MFHHDLLIIRLNVTVKISSGSSQKLLWVIRARACKSARSLGLFAAHKQSFSLIRSPDFWIRIFFSFLSENFPEFITLDHTRQMKRQVLAGNLLRFQQISDIKLSKPHCRHNSVRGVTQWLYGFLRKSVKLYAWGLTFPPFMKQSCTPSSNGGWLFSSLHTALILHLLKHKLIYLLMT